MFSKPYKRSTLCLFGVFLLLGFFAGILVFALASRPVKQLSFSRPLRTQSSILVEHTRTVSLNPVVQATWFLPIGVHDEGRPIDIGEDSKIAIHVVGSYRVEVSGVALVHMFSAEPFMMNGAEAVRIDGVYMTTLATRSEKSLRIATRSSVLMTIAPRERDMTLTIERS